MSQRFTISRVSRHFVYSALALHFSLLAGCNGNTPLQLFGSDSSSGQPKPIASLQPSGQATQGTGGQGSSDGGSSSTGTTGNVQAGSTTLASGPQIGGGKYEQRMPVYAVVGQGMSGSQARQLADVFGIQNLKLEEDGSVSFLDDDKFQHLPVGTRSESEGFQTQATYATVSPKIQVTQYPYPYPSLKPTALPTAFPTVNPSAIPSTKPSTKPSGDPDEFDPEENTQIVRQYLNLAAIQKIQTLPERVALDKILIGLNKAGLMPQGNPVTGHSEFESRSLEGETIKVQLDTQVGFEQSLGQYKLIGPGAKVKVVMDGDGSVTQLRYAGRQLSSAGMVPVMAPDEAEKLALEKLEQEDDQNKGQWRLTSEMIYYAPPLSQQVKNILPHYQVKATMQGPAGEITSRILLIPAVQDGPRLKLDMHQDGGAMQAKAEVAGGTAPYRYSWSSSSSAIDAQSSNRAEISYKLSPRERGNQETLYLTVTDANGLTSSARVSRQLSHTTMLQLADAAQFKTMMPGRFDAGVEWVGQSMGLGGSHDNAYGFVNGFNSRGTPIEFNWGDNNAWEEDFKPLSMGGTDDYYVDNVDMVFYTGHANGNGWSFPGAHDDGFLDYHEASYGERELEWLMIAACGPMQISEGGVHLFDRWGKAFKGLHMLAGYATISYDNTIEGDRLARHLLADNLTVRNAWAQMATEAQPASVIYGYMGVYGPNGLSDYNDHYWGHGSVGPDIHDIRGHWAIHSPS